MSLLTLTDITLHLGNRRIFSDCNLRVGDADRIGLIGPNGSGKTSLLRLLTGELEVDGGKVQRAREVRIGYLPQQLESFDGVQLLELMRASVPERDVLLREFAEIEAELSKASENSSNLSPEDEQQLMEMTERLTELRERIDHFERYYADHIALRILAGLGFAESDTHRNLGELSGGWQMRAKLAALLFEQPDILLLDEPTNHLDLPSVAWLGKFLERYQHSFILICHDREFLNAQINSVVSLEPEGLRTYRGNYERYLRQRAEEEIVLENRARNLAREREKTQAFIDRFRAQANKAKAVQSRVKALERMDEVQELSRHRVAKFVFPPTTRTSHVVLEGEGINKAYGDLRVLSNVDVRVERGEKIGVIGINGAGKTTLLRTLANEIAADSGEVKLGSHVVPGFYAQHHGDTLNEDATIFQEVAALAKGASPTSIRSLLGTLLFVGDDVDKTIGVLSGGERARVALAKLLIVPRNLMLMDEPTNHLDLASTERLTASLKEYDGALVFVSHNLSFIRNLATRIWNVADGGVETYPGTLDEYLESSLRRFELPENEGKSKNRQSSGPADAAAASQSVKRASRQEEKERKRREAEIRKYKSQVLGPLKKLVAQLETEIGELEEMQRLRGERLSDPDVFATVEGAELSKEYQEDIGRLDTLTATWEQKVTELEEKQEAAEQQAG